MMSNFKGTLDSKTVEEYLNWSKISEQLFPNLEWWLLPKEQNDIVKSEEEKRITEVVREYSKVLKEKGVFNLTWTWAWYGDESSLWQDIAYSGVFSDYTKDDYEITNIIANLDAFSDDGKWLWDIETGEIKKVAEAYVSEPQLVIEEI